MTKFLLPCLRGLALALLLNNVLPASAQESAPQAEPTVPTQKRTWVPNDKPFYREFYDDTFGSTSKLWKEGDWGLMLPAWTVHMRFAYTKEQRNDQNNNPHPAFGINKGMYMPSGNWSSLYAMEFQDSWDKPSWMAGYNYNWIWREGNLRWGVGAVMGLMMRNDYFSYAPFPFILPSFQVGYKWVSIESAYVPGIKKGTGNVALLLLRLQSGALE
ncbi:hypothetical protein [Viridibacterium curvum]|uniref:Lipid A palmitoyltransferase PagP n=1 Tax=Viridibacterium curvum TaxID=1101404 RepID=A0ABP9R4R4_9RHOO